MMDETKKKMAIHAHSNMMEEGQKLLNDPAVDDEMKSLVRQEMENSRQCMEAFGLT